MRLAAAMLAGLASLLWTVSVVNLWLPLAGVWGWCCLAPMALTLGPRETRAALGRDMIAVGGSRRGMALTAAAAGFGAFLLWPLLTRPDVVYYDGTSGHDAFFWIVGAEHLKRQNYLQAPVVDAVYPLYYSAGAITGWRPPWGRMGAEGLLALASNVAGASPLKIYLAATAALFPVWVAAVFLLARTFLVDRLPPAAAVALGAFQPLFVFFHANANLPNLLGVLLGACAAVATARASEPGARQAPWLALLALSLHGVLCAYPELLPVAGLPCALLWLRGWHAAGWRAGVGSATAVAGATFAAILLNPASTIRGWNGFKCSLDSANHPERWPGIFDGVSPFAQVPALATLSERLGHNLGAIGGTLVTIGFGGAMVYVLIRARDRFGALALFAGVVVMLVFAAVTGFGYGWQKSVQFSAIFISALSCAAVTYAFDGRGDAARWVRVPRLAGAVAMLALLATATLANGRDVQRWSARKVITAEWFDLRSYARRSLRNMPVLVDSATFPTPFFYGMWATYFMMDSRVYFAASDPGSAGYLRGALLEAPPNYLPPPRAVLVAGHAAETAKSEPLWSARSVGLLEGRLRPRGLDGRPEPQ